MDGCVIAMMEDKQSINREKEFEQSEVLSTTCICLQSLMAHKTAINKSNTKVLICGDIFFIWQASILAKFEFNKRLWPLQRFAFEEMNERSASTAVDCIASHCKWSCFLKCIYKQSPEDIQKCPSLQVLGNRQ